ncbi:MAG: hypothetical protein ABJL99_23795 [Aliishimia sp.]
MRGLILFLLLLIVVGGLFATNPPAAAFETEVETQLTNAISKADPGALGDDLSAVILTTCQLGGSACARVLRSFMTIEIEDNVLFSRGTVRLGDGDPTTCYGILTRVICPLS